MLKISSNINNDDFDLFVHLHETEIGGRYPFSTKKTALSFIDTHSNEFDPLGYFTKRKKIWKATNLLDEVVGFTVVTEKRGGSIKFGPTIVSPMHQNKGIGGRLRLEVEQEYQQQGYRKAYSTTNLKNLPAIFYISKIGYRIELHLKNHYEIGADELVLSKFLNPIVAQIPQTINDIELLSDIERRIFVETSKFCSEIDLNYFSNIRKASKDDFEISEDFFIHKGKKVFASNDVEAVAITTPKRGGCVKISPLILSNAVKKNQKLIDDIISFYKPKGFHKLYAIITLNNIGIDFLKSQNFFIEGIIAEPYCKGVDMILLSKFLL